MSNLNFSINETAEDDHEIHVKIKIKGKKSEVRKVLTAYLEN